LSATQRPGAVSAIHSGLLMTVNSREDGKVSRTDVNAPADRLPVRTTTAPVIGALRRSRCLTYRFTGSPASKITGESVMITGHMASATAAWATGPRCLSLMQQG